jgi:hypothetical protein
MSSDGADGEASPLDEVVPDDFLDTWGASTYEEALERAEQAPTTTPDDELPRCPVCGTQRVYPRGTKGSAGQDRENDTDYVCSDRHHFSNPVYGDPEELDLREEDTDGADGGDEVDPFVWVSEEDLAEPPLTRQLAALNDDVLAALAIYCYRPWHHTAEDPSYRDLGRIFPYSRDWVGERVREWKRGEHREKVADPRRCVTVGGAAGAEGVSAE